ncbi:hypothetical protein X943_002869 [Babesia divergens]|uniref:Uncharacterized protein n=1 Tax=Babesia divergens TaxID=32595 RepID=A0AAD9GHQ1_BABDI|nr:hypothetical protein X943_002869 [Babesia divergens]
MRSHMRGRFPHDNSPADGGVVGEILEDIECLQLDESDSDVYNDLNDDTFGDGADCAWDPTATFQEALQESTTRRTHRANRELVKCDIFELPEPKLLPQHHQRKPKPNHQPSNHGQSSHNSQHQKSIRQNDADEPANVDRSGLWESDLANYRRLGWYTLSPHFITLVSEGKASSHKRWAVSQRTLERHARCVERSDANMEKELFMNYQAFDQVLRIHLTQICKDPRLQTYSGRWNARHLGLKTGTNSTTEAAEATSPDQKSGLNPNRFGRTSAASVRHGRRLIHLNDLITKPREGPVRKERQLRETIEVGYEALYMLCDIEEEIEQCPMNHVAALDKMQKDREGRLNQLFVSLTTGSHSIEDIMGLNKGRKLLIKLGKKLSIETKLQLACCMIDCAPAFCRICEELENVFRDEPSLVGLIQQFESSYNLKPLVAFDREEEERHDEGYYQQQLLFNANSYTQCFLFIVESLTLAGNLLLLKSETGGRQTALQRCCAILLKYQQQGGAFAHLLSTRGGVVFMSILLDRICQVPMAVDKSTLDMVVHYTLEASEGVTCHDEEWKSLAATIMKLFQ